MRIPRIYTAASLSPGEHALDSRAAHYLGQVLRMKAGRNLVLFNGDGLNYPAQITEVSKKGVQCRVDPPNASAEPPPPLFIELGIAISKGDRMDLVIQKATELGVSRISPLTSERVDVKLSGERLEKKAQHWQQVMISACEQSGRNRLVELAPLQPLDQWRDNLRSERKLVLHPTAAQRLGGDSPGPASVALLIGPEGGLTDDEVQACLNQGFAGLQLGPRVLRTETAPLAAISILQFCWGDMA
ncbi:16S rRNA (uracil(1498)-N(3))-methyltransferase [Spongiibacter taiwanensis]|uniref:16S rRNA (uracil(1498)-N(3))-methyltransferase n=1 Tax=Spongiibacter taiwanensis TaxID=1748242 RepID=UPI002036103C|nr:16S rRNA (uracil(1498)-N(3))-methyltransferase [Spongiibacter taiwanensis]USA44785.1 16S rRNA (uracil(1498)-N(3))-methyltransferase [Spongiibacter taiwanensis]